MNRTLLRGTLYGAGIGLPIWGLFLAFFTAWFWVPIVAGMLLVIVAGLIDWTGRDVGYGETVFGPVVSEIVHTPAIALTVIEGGRRAVWPTEIGAPE